MYRFNQLSPRTSRGWRAGARCVAVLVILLCAALAFAQVETGQISGTVTDSTGAVVPNAKITVTSKSTGAVRTATSNQSGDYAITNLPPGNYNISVEAANFAKTSRDLNVAVGSKNEVSPQLQVAGGGTTVEVTAQGATEVETTTAELSQVVNANQVSQLPSLARNPYDFVNTTGNVATEPFPTPRGVGVNIAGARSASTSILLDGGENVNEFTASTGQTVPLDSVQEFRVITNDFSAEYGRASGGVVNVATKSGGNDFHGSLYEFNRLSALATNTFDNNAQGIPKSVFTRNQFGYSVGGPIKKNKLFFFNSTEWTRVRTSANEQNYVIDPAVLPFAAANAASYFSSSIAQLRPNAAVIQRLTASQLSAASFAGGPNFSKIPGSTPVLDLVNFGANADAGGGFPQNTWNSVARIDYNLTDKTTMYGRYTYFHSDQFPGTITFSPYAGFDTGETFRDQNAQINLTHIWTPNVVSQTKFTYNRLNDVEPLGTQPVVPTLFFSGGAPIVQVPGAAAQQLLLPGYTATTPGNALPFGGPQNVGEIGQDLSWTRGKHQFRFGGNYVYIQDDRAFGAYEESSEFFDSSGSTATGFENFLAGQLDGFFGAVNPQGKFPCVRSLATGKLNVTPGCTLAAPLNQPSFSRSYRFNDFGLYAQDSWKVRPRLTLNLGVRWEYYGVQHDNHTNLDSNFYLGSGATFQDQIRNGFVATTNSNNPVGGFWKPNYHNFAPRLGFAYDVFGDGKTSIRGGYGIAYERNFGNVTFNTIQNPPNYAVVALGPANVSGAPFIPLSPDNLAPLSGTSVPLPPVTLRAIKQNIATAYNEVWNLSVQREVVKNTVASVEYSGSHGVHLYDIANVNQQSFGSLYESDALTFGRAHNRLNPQYGNINYRGDNGFSHYNALNLRLSSSNLFNQGLSINTNYTYSHSIDNLSSTFSELNQSNGLGYLNPFNPAFDKGNSDFDVRHRFVVSGVWDPPYAKNFTGWKKQALDGWELTPIFNAQTGYPFTVFDCTNTNFVTCGRYIPGGSFATSGTSNGMLLGPNNFQYLSLPLAATSYSATAPGGLNTGFGNVPSCSSPGVCAFPANMTGRNSFQAPGTWNMNMGIYKNFKLTERFNMQFRSEWFNLFNHSNYYVQVGGPFSTFGGSADVSPSFNATPQQSTFALTGKRGVSNPAFAGSLGERRFIQFALKLTF